MGHEPVDEVVLGVVGLAGHAVQALVGVLVDVAVVVDAAGRSSGTASWWRGSVVRMKSSLEMSSSPHASRKRVAGRCGLLRGREPVLLGRPLHLQPVLVGAGEEADVVAEQPVPARQGVGGDRRVGVADVGHVVDVVDRRGHVEPGHPLRLPTATMRRERRFPPSGAPDYGGRMAGRDLHRHEVIDIVGQGQYDYMAHAARHFDEGGDGESGPRR